MSAADARLITGFDPIKSKYKAVSARRVSQTKTNGVDKTRLSHQLMMRLTAASDAFARYIQSFLRVTHCMKARYIPPVVSVSPIIVCMGHTHTQRIVAHDIALPSGVDSPVI